MEISALVRNAGVQHDVEVCTGGQATALAVAAKPAGGGSAVNGGEFLMLALATCYCNDLYREATTLGLQLERVEVEARAAFDGIGLAARDVRYRAAVTSSTATPAQIAELIQRTDAVAEIHNTLRRGVPVTLITG